MTIEETKERIAVMQAYVDGKQIQGMCSDGKWVYVPEPSWSINENFRIKPEPKYRPFKDADECWQEMLKHQPFGWVKEKGDKLSYELLACVSENDEAPISFAVYGSVGMGIIDRPSIEFNEMFNAFTFADGAPFGVKEGVWEN